MLIVKIELWPGGVERAAKLARLEIENIGGAGGDWDYHVRENSRGRERCGLVRAHRRDEVAVALVRKAIAALEEANVPSEAA